MNAVIYAILGGILPALVWLTFWLWEDKKHPEPKGLILKTFLLGALSVLLVIPLQKGVEEMFPHLLLLSVFLWALIEEVFKFLAGYWGGLRSLEDNEPVDPIIYMVTSALGFVAFENTLFILGPIMGQDVTQSIITGNLRFMGASLLHVVSSGFVGALISLNFYNPSKRKRFILIGLAIATAFHFLFNFLILKWETGGMALAFIMVWIGVVALLWTFERIKSFARDI